MASEIPGSALGVSIIHTRPGRVLRASTAHLFGKILGPALTGPLVSLFGESCGLWHHRSRFIHQVYHELGWESSGSYSAHTGQPVIRYFPRCQNRYNKKRRSYTIRSTEDGSYSLQDDRSTSVSTVDYHRSCISLAPPWILKIGRAHV